MNINKFCEDLPNIIHLPGTWDLEEKASFVRACDGMIHARQYSETFGLACGEFALENKPIITYFGSNERNHIDVLGERGLYYNNVEDLDDILKNFTKYIKYDDYDLPYKQFSPEIIMNKFNKLFLN
jgi:hypothetical protein